MFFRHSAVLWTFENLAAGQTASPLMRHVNPGFDDGSQEILCLFELDNTEVDGTVTAWLELGAEGIFIPTEKASPGQDQGGNPLPYVGPGPHHGGFPLFPDTGGSGGPPTGLFTITLGLPLVRVRVEVGDGAQPNLASGRLVLVSNGPVAVRPETP